MCVIFELTCGGGVCENKWQRRKIRRECGCKKKGKPFVNLSTISEEA
jgi:hypothetical protein